MEIALGGDMNYAEEDSESDRDDDHSLSEEDSLSEDEMDISGEEIEGSTYEEAKEEDEEVGNKNIENHYETEDDDMNQLLREDGAPAPAGFGDETCLLEDDSYNPDHDSDSPLRPRRSGRTSRPHSRFGYYEAHLSTSEPKTYAQAITAKDHQEWQNAMEDK
ncbi:hypothetical protein Q9L58_010289 [Maublancomyces gigas]|uniref:Uncharacterized protein n=1 Tax=Discina gigas TaxID=1032678 RepID=A0ABR3G4R0_9PEZI